MLTTRQTRPTLTRPVWQAKEAVPQASSCVCGSCWRARLGPSATEAVRRQSVRMPCGLASSVCSCTSPSMAPAAPPNPHPHHVWNTATHFWGACMLRGTQSGHNLHGLASGLCCNVRPCVISAVAEREQTVCHWGVHGVQCVHPDLPSSCMAAVFSQARSPSACSWMLLIGAEHASGQVLC